jgi:hypothetical protein
MKGVKGRALQGGSRPRAEATVNSIRGELKTKVRPSMPGASEAVAEEGKTWARLHSLWAVSEHLPHKSGKEE